MVSITIYFLYDVFRFHTYGEVVHYDNLLTLDNEQISLENFEVYKDENEVKVGGGTLTFKNSDIIPEGTVIKVLVEVSNTNKNNQIIYEIVYLKGQSSYQLEYQDIKIKDSLNNIENAKIVINYGEQEIKDNLNILDLNRVNGSNKIYRIDNAYLGSSFMRLGYISTNDITIIDKYPSINLEYRYLEEVDGKEEYVVFKKIEAKTKEYFNNPQNYIYYHNKEDSSLLDKQLSVVIILENDQDNYIFSIDLTEVGETNE